MSDSVKVWLAGLASKTGGAEKHRVVEISDDK